jgi:transposase
MADTYRLFVGIDIAAATATVSWQVPGRSPSTAITIDQTPEGYRVLHGRLGKLGPSPTCTLVVMEASSPYWASLATFLVRHGYVVSVINPYQAHHFAKALLKRAKTDAIDAQTLAQLALLLQPSPWTPPPALYEELYQRLAQRDALLGMQNQVRNQRHALIQGPVIIASVRERLDALDEQLTQQITTIDQELLMLLAEATVQQHEWARTITCLQTIPGIGLVTALWMVVSTLNFTICTSAEQLASYAGLAPMPHQSGTSVKKYAQIGHSGNSRLRTAVYLATLSGARYNPLLKAFYDRLLQAGKPKKVARCAVARKLLHLAWAIGTNHRQFDATYHQPAA